MKLGHWMQREKLTLAEVGERIDKHLSSVQKYVLGRVPSKETMVRIFVLSRGEVTPNDFYDLPELMPAEPSNDDQAPAGAPIAALG